MKTTSIKIIKKAINYPEFTQSVVKELSQPLVADLLRTQKPGRKQQQEGSHIYGKIVITPIVFRVNSRLSVGY